MTNEIVERALAALEAAGCTRRIVPQPTREDYHRLATAALRRIGAMPHLPAALRWLEHAHPDRYHELFHDLRDAIDALWDARAPLADFERALDAWVDAHQRAIADYTAAVSAQESA